MKYIRLVLILINFVAFSSKAQLPNTGPKTDTNKIIKLNEVIIKDQQAISEIERLTDVKESVIYAGKKTEVIQMSRLNADLSTNNSRQIFAKVPGLSIWENDGSGIQVGIAARGLSPNRSWEFNMRQNGYEISSEVFGYPESYYSPPTEALEKIEIVRGSASLQFGPQFGGVVNYKIKKGNPNKLFAFETQQTLGSYGLFNTYNAIGGTIKKFSYYAFYHQRSAEGWRENSQYNTKTGYFSFNYSFNRKLSLSGEYTAMVYKSQQAGGLTDLQFNENPRLSSRERNWFGAPFSVASVSLKYAITDKLNLQVKTFLTLAERNSVGYLKSIITKDSINPTTLQYNERQVDRDSYKNYGAEVRLTYKYKLFTEHTLATGIRMYKGNTNRNQLGIGTTGSDFNLALLNPTYGRSLTFETTNYAAFAENIFQIGKRLKVVPGIRFEYIENEAKGYINTTSSAGLIDSKKTRSLFLYGIGSEFKITENTNLYSNYSLAYRPVTFSELTPSATTEVIDPNLKDANGFNFDFGYRGSVKKIFSFDIGVFYLNYKNRIGLITLNNNPFKTNIGNSVNKGIESFVEVDIVRLFTPSSHFGNLSVFASNSLIDAKYVTWNNPAIANDPTKSIEGKRVENVPSYIHRFGTTYSNKGLSFTIQLNCVGAVFTDAVNTETPNATGTIGKISSYKVLDASLAYKFLGIYNIKAGVNNITDEKYATRRATGYPGPGLLPGNGRTFFISFGASF